MKTNLIRALFIAILATLSSGMGSSWAAPVHPCASQAAEQALKLLKFHSNNDDRAEVFEDRITSIGTIKALKGSGRFDVLEVPGGIYKGDYRLRMIYAQISGECVLMGQEVIERSDPY